MFKNQYRNWIAALAAPLGFAAAAAYGSAGSPGALVAHEWGTFTSLSGSDGRAMEGLQHEDGLLPDFVHSRLKVGQSDSLRLLKPMDVPHGGCHGKGCDFTPEAGTLLGVTQKMETPVIYFYSDEAQKVKVDVDFPGGLITQWYPEATSFSPTAFEVNALANGHITWDAQLSASPLPIASVPESSIWAPSRQVASNFLSAQGENEKLIFYRGLGRFDTAFTVRSIEDRKLELSNSSSQSVPEAFLLQVNRDSGSIRPLGSVPANGSIRTDESAGPAEAMPFYLDRATSMVAESLVRSGLRPDEAQAMVNTWKSSYFRTPGYRVLYVLPRAWTDQLLPIRIQPEPKELVRTLVGRVEVMTRSEEKALLGELKAADRTTASATIARLGRFAEPKLRRIAELSTGESQDFQRFVGTLIQIVQSQ